MPLAPIHKAVYRKAVLPLALVRTLSLPGARQFMTKKESFTQSASAVFWLVNIDYPTVQIVALLSLPPLPQLLNQKSRCNQPQQTTGNHLASQLQGGENLSPRRVPPWRCQLSDLSPADQLKDHHYDGDDQQDVQQTTGSERSHQPQNPQNQKYYGNCVQHDRSPSDDDAERSASAFEGHIVGRRSFSTNQLNTRLSVGACPALIYGKFLLPLQIQKRATAAQAVTL